MIQLNFKDALAVFFKGLWAAGIWAVGLRARRSGPKVPAINWALGQRDCERSIGRWVATLLASEAQRDCERGVGRRGPGPAGICLGLRDCERSIEHWVAVAGSERGSGPEVQFCLCVIVFKSSEFCPLSSVSLPGIRSVMAAWGVSEEVDVDDWDEGDAMTARASESSGLGIAAEDIAPDTAAPEDCEQQSLSCTGWCGRMRGMPDPGVQGNHEASEPKLLEFTPEGQCIYCVLSKLLVFGYMPEEVGVSRLKIH